jgi:hypothetical protein
MDAKRVSALNVDIIDTFFAEFEELQTTYIVDPEDIYNIDKTGFQMGHTQSEFVVYNSSQGPAMVSTSENIN